MKALVIFSGGQDSTTCLYWALNRYQEVEAISFVYGQKHKVEIEAAKGICLIEKVKHTIVDVSFFPELVNSALTSNGDVNELRSDGLPTSFVPNRNALFITLAHAYAQKIGASKLVAGMCETDYSGYPDCRQHFVHGMETVLNYGSNVIIDIDTPLMKLSKAQTFELAASLNKLDQIVELTHTCYNGDHNTAHVWGYGCGACPACVLRAKGYSEYATMLRK